MRVLLLTGSGGAGTSTVAAATVAHARRCGVKAGLFDTGAPLPDGRRWEHVLAVAAALTGARRPPHLARGQLPAPPLADRLGLLLELGERMRTGRDDLLVVDLPALPEALALLALPHSIAAWLDAVAPVEERVSRTLRAERGGPRRRPPAVLDAVDGLREDLDGVQAALAGPRASLRLVVRPESAAVDAALAALAPLSLYGLKVDGLVAGLLVPGGGRDAWRGTVAAGESAQVARLQAAGLPVVRTTRDAAAPVGEVALAALGRALAGDADVVAAPARTATLRVEPDGDGYLLRLDLPLAHREELALTRDGDHLVVTVGCHRRRLGLPSGLRRCAVERAALRDGELRVRLVPDPELWRVS